MSRRVVSPRAPEDSPRWEAVFGRRTRSNECHRSGLSLFQRRRAPLASSVPNWTARRNERAPSAAAAIISRANCKSIASFRRLRPSLGGDLLQFGRVRLSSLSARFAPDRTWPSPLPAGSMALAVGSGDSDKVNQLFYCPIECHCCAIWSAERADPCDESGQVAGKLFATRTSAQ